ncbi:hypothetical protein H4219_001147 [Mycoemilia scoparia]|uniref:UDP-glucose 4-epimerase n=1 Tax=Mycoemilia scoparia TaxID=417184 RepID=A0A9W8A6S5_9FUNG|nr:hypothetical protein H4219_001147 [Mycoemilia scoparia]
MTSADNYILVTGGAGYIGSHTILVLLNAGYKVVAVDNLSNSSRESLNRAARLSNVEGEVPFHQIDLQDVQSLRKVFQKYSIKGVIHFAALKSVGESVEKPLLYYRNNITGTLNLLDVMVEFGVKDIVFSSSATVYKADPKNRPLKEDCDLGCINPYGRTKYFMESIIKDVVDSQEGWNAIMLRYFNPTGAHPSGDMGEDPQEIPNNLMPYVSQVAIGKLEKVHVFGNDYDTIDGTGVRDYIHVMDLAEGHLAALKKLGEKKCGFDVYNLGSGTGYSVLEMIRAMSKACGHDIPYIFDKRRPGDLGTVVCDPSKSEAELGFKVKHGLEEMCADLWRWQSNYPNGYND